MTTTAESQLVHSPLHDWHVQHGARMIDFVGWSLPICYDWPASFGGGGGIIEEHKQVRSSGGVFDVSHMGRIDVSGRHARRLLERMVSRRISDMTEGQCRYALVLNERGGVRDDVLVYRFDDTEFMVVCNGANRDKILAHMRTIQAQGTTNGALDACKIHDKTRDTAMVAIQGPRVMDLIAKVSTEVPTLKRYRFVEKNLLIMKLLVSRTGYTGENGVEVILPAKVVSMAMKMLLKDAGPDANAIVKPCGLGARDTLRLEAGMPLYGHELDEDTDALASGLDFAITLDKHQDQNSEDAIGLAALRAIRSTGGPKQRLVGLVLEGKRTARQGMGVRSNNTNVGRVTSGCLSPTLGDSIAMAYIDAACSTPGHEVQVDLGRDRVLPARVTTLPFYKPA